MLRRLRRYGAIRREARLVLRSGLLDREWYLSRYEDVAQAGLDPVMHFLRHGGQERRNPSPAFDTGDYVAQHPEIVADGINPLVHHLLRATDALHHQDAGRQTTARPKLEVPPTDFSGADAPTSDSLGGWAWVRVHRLPQGGVVRLHLHHIDGSVGEIVLDAARRDGGQVVWLEPAARLSALADGAPVTVQEIPQHQAMLRLLLADHGRRAPDHLRALHRQGVASWLDTQSVASRPVTLDAYGQWALRHDTPTAAQLSGLQARAAQLAKPPRFSVIVPVHETAPDALHAMIGSVRRQAYPHWQLCLVDDASRQPHVRRLLRRAARDDPRVAVAFRAENGHIAAASNTAIGLAQGDWLAMMDHDDVLPPQALATMALAIAANPDTDLLYSDEDKLDAQGRRYGAYFKPDFNPELLEAQNFLNHLTVYRASAVQAVGGLRVGLEGSQDYDLALRVTAATRERVVHVPHVLYHWRFHPAAGTFSSTQPERAAVAARQALRDHAAAGGETVEVVASHIHRVLRPPPPHWPRVTAIVPTRDHLDVLRVCVGGLLDGTDYPALDIIVVDNASEQPDTLAWLDAITARGVTVLRYPHSFNYSAINNFAAGQARGEILLLLNSDIAVIEPGWLREMVRLAMRPGIGAVGAKLLYPDDTVQHAGVVLGMGGVGAHVYCGAARDDHGYYGRLWTMQEVGCVTAACMAVPASAYAAVGGFDAEHLAVAFNDVDFCLRLRASGRRILWTPQALLYHCESRSRGSDFAPEQHARFQAEIDTMKARWPAELARDPFFNPNFSDDKWPHYAAPPRVTPPWAMDDREPLPG